jgi:hypothetical protein
MKNFIKKLLLIYATIGLLVIPVAVTLVLITLYKTGSGRPY